MPRRRPFAMDILPICAAWLLPFARGGKFSTCRMRPRAQQDAILLPRVKARHLSHSTALNEFVFRVK